MNSERIQQELRQFASERDWSQFHTPKNLAMALAGETGELLAAMQWERDEVILESAPGSDLHERIATELADVLIYALRLADVLRIDLPEAIESKISQNAERYPAQEVRGSASKRPRG